jgi:hypothetical protein
MTQASTDRAIEKAKALFQGPTENAKRSPVHPGNGVHVDLPAYLAHYSDKVQVLKTKELEDGTILHCLKNCVFDPSHTPNDAAIGQKREGVIFYQCFHDSCKGKTWSDVKEKISGDASLAPFVGRETETPSLDLSKGLLTADSFLSLEIIHRKPLIEPWLSEGCIGIAVGWRGVGKSHFLMSVGEAISKCAPLGPWTVKNAVPVLYLDGEMVASEYQERTWAVGKLIPGERQAPFLVYNDHYATSVLGLPKVNLTKEEHRQAVTKMCLECGVKVLLLDNISSLCPGLEENKKDQWDPMNQWLLALRFQGISTVFAHHAGKDGSQRGTSGREDNLDFSISLEYPPNYSIEQGCHFIVKFKKARVRTSQLPLIADVEFQLTEKDGIPVWAWDDVKTRTSTQIVRLLSEGMKQGEVAEILKISKGQVSKLRTKAVKDDYLTEKNTLTRRGVEMLAGEGF